MSKDMGDKYKDMYESGFFIEIQELHQAMEEVIEKYGMRDRCMSVVVTGILDPVNEDTSQLKALFSYNLESRDELDEIIQFITNTYEDQNPDLDDLLDGLGISLN